MNEELKNRTREWMELERKTFEQRKKAESFYEENLLELIVDDYLTRNGDYVFETVKYLMISVGTSYEPIVLNIRLFDPEKILFLYTDKSEETLDKVVELCRLTPKEYSKAKVNETDPLDIYREIKKAYQEWKNPEKVYIDFTGGTKAMSAAAALAGALIKVQLVYVGSSEYMPDFRKPRPGSEELIYIDNPLTVFGDMEIQKVLVLLEKNEFAGAKARIGNLKESLPDPELRSQMEFLYTLAETYEAWDSFDFTGAYESIRNLNRILNRDRIHREYILMDERPALKKQEKLLETLSVIPGMIAEKKNAMILKDKAIVNALMFSLYQNAVSREKQEKYDMATLLFYRTLEFIEQRRLSAYDLYVSAMDYLNLKPNLKLTPEYGGKKPRERIEILRTRVTEIRTQLFQHNISDYLSEQVSLLDGFVILLALRDPIMGKNDKDGIRLLKLIRSKVYLRNNSIFAHGLGPVKPDEYRRFSTFVTDMLKNHCEKEKISFEEYSESVRFVIPESLYGDQREDS